MEPSLSSQPQDGSDAPAPTTPHEHRSHPTQPHHQQQHQQQLTYAAAVPSCAIPSPSQFTHTLLAMASLEQQQQQHQQQQPSQHPPHQIQYPPISLVLNATSAGFVATSCPGSSAAPPTNSLQILPNIIGVVQPPPPLGQSGALAIMPQVPQRPLAGQTDNWAGIPDVRPADLPAGVATMAPSSSLQFPQGPIDVGAQFPTSKDLRVAVETKLMLNGRGLMCKQGGSRQKKYGCAGCGYLVRAVKATGIPKGTGSWKISSIENANHSGCIGGRMRPSSKALIDVTGALRVDPTVPTTTLQAQLLEQGIIVNRRQLARAKWIVGKKPRGSGSESDGGSGTAQAGTGKSSVNNNGGDRGGVVPSRGTKRRKSGTAAASGAGEVPNLSQESDEQIIRILVQGGVEIHRLEQALKGDYFRAVRLRRSALEQLRTKSAAQRLSREDENVMSGLPFKGMDYSRIFGKNCENVVGFLPMPVGVAGPLLIDGEEVWVPLATTEGGLVASINRGCAAISEGGYGGARTEVTDDGITRAPCIAMPDIHQAFKLKQWTERTSGTDAGFPVLLNAFESSTKHGRLVSVKASLAGRYVYLRFKCTTGDAMGMNMVSKGCEAAVREIQGRFKKARLVALSGNTCTDKKSSARNWIEGRGKSIVVEAVLSARTVSLILKTTVKKMVECNIVKNLIGSAMAGSIGGFNSHAANVVAAVFLATGQDPAHTVEGSNCITLMEEVRSGEEPSCGGRPGDLHVTVTLPSLPVGTVGGGTGLPAQSACLQLTGSCSVSKGDSFLTASASEKNSTGFLSAAGAQQYDTGFGNESYQLGGVITGDCCSGGGSSQRTAISLVADVAAAAAAAAEVEEAAAAISLLPGGGSSAAGGSTVSTPLATSVVSTSPGAPGGSSSTGKGKGPVAGARARTSDAGFEPMASLEAKNSWPIDAGKRGGLPEAGARRLACVIGAAVMAGELSLLAALASNDLVNAHMALNRDKKTDASAFSPGRLKKVPIVRTSYSVVPFGVSSTGLTSSWNAVSSEAAGAQEGGNGSLASVGNFGGGGVSGENLWRMDTGPAALQLEAMQVAGMQSGATPQSELMQPHAGSGEAIQTDPTQALQSSGALESGGVTPVQPDAMQPGPAAMHAAIQAAPRMDVASEQQESSESSTHNEM